MLPTPQINFQKTPVTLIVTAIAVAIELVCLVGDDRRHFYYNTAQLGIWVQIWDGQLWRPFTTTVLHGGPLHLAMNLSVLLGFGPVLETRLGSYRYLAVIVLLAYVSSLAQYIIGDYYVPVDKQAGLVGLSGVLFGFAGLMYVGRRYHSDLAIVFGPQSVQFIGIWFLACVVLTQLGLLRIGNIAHGAGFAFGVLYGMAIFSPRHRRLWIIASTVATLLIMATLIACPGHPAYEHIKHIKAVRGW